MELPMLHKMLFKKIRSALILSLLYLFLFFVLKISRQILMYSGEIFPTPPLSLCSGVDKQLRHRVPYTMFFFECSLSERTKKIPHQLL
jgi:hypothetical protein